MNENNLTREATPAERIANSLLGLLEAMIDSFKNKPVRTLIKMVVLSWFTQVAIAFVVFTGIIVVYALYTSTDRYRFNKAKGFLMIKYGPDWTQHLDELKPFDYVVH